MPSARQDARREIDPYGQTTDTLPAHRLSAALLFTKRHFRIGNLNS
jgi:hypothetical protein